MKSSARFHLASIGVFLVLALVSAANGQDKEKSKADKQPAKVDEGRALLLQAFEVSKTAREPKGYSQLIELCDQGIAKAESDVYKTYGKKLAAWAYYKRGEALANASPPQEKEALADFEASVKHLADVPKAERPDWEDDLLHNRGVSYAVARDREKALADFNRAIELNSRYGKAYFNRGEVHFALNKLAEAIADYDAAIRNGYAESVVYTHRGTAHFKREDVARAVVDYNQAIARNAQDYEAYTFRGDAYSASGNHAQAVRDYQRAISLNDKYGRAYFSAAWLRATCPDPRYRDAESAVRSAKRAIELDGEDYRYLEALAAAHARSGQFDEAMAQQKKAIGLISKEDKDALETAQTRLAMYEKSSRSSQKNPPAAPLANSRRFERAGDRREQAKAE